MATYKKINAFLFSPEIATKGGVQSYMKRVGEVLQSCAKAEKYIYSLNDSCDQLKEAQIDCYTKGFSKNKFRFVTSFLRSVKGADVVLSGHLGLSPVGFLLKKVGFIKKHFIILHGIEAWKKVSWLERLALKDADVVVATTVYTAKICSTINEFDINKIKVIPLCCDETTIYSESNVALGGGFNILCVGRLAKTEKLKGYETLISAIELIVKRGNSDVFLNMVGDGDYRQVLQEIAKNKGVDNLVKFLGKVSDENLQNAYKQCNIFAMPSKKEGFGIVFLEAMRHGKACLGGNYGGTPEVIDDGVTGFLVEWNDHEEIAEHIMDLYKDENKLKSMGEAGRKKYEENYSFSLFSQRFIELIQGNSV